MPFRGIEIYAWPRQAGRPEMADFVQKSETKTATRELAAPIGDVAGFTAIVQSVIANNPFSCVAYMTAGVTHDAVEKTKESYTARIVYEDAEGKFRGKITVQAPDVTAFEDIAALVLGNATYAEKMGGTAHRDVENETFSATLKCHDANGELYNVVFGKKTVRLNSYEDDAIRDRIETWADSVSALG